MDFNRLGHSGLRVPALSFGTATFGGGNDFFKAWGSTDAARRIAADRRLPRSRRQSVRHRRRLFRRLGRADPGRGDQGQARPTADLHQGDIPDGRGPERLRLVAPASLRGGRGVAEAARHRPDRPLPTARPGLQHAGRGDAVDPRPARARRQGPLHRLLEFLRLASDEVARGVGPLRLSPLRRAPGLLFAAQSRLRMGAHAARRDQGVGAVIWSPLGWGKLTGKIRRGQPAQPGTPCA